MFTSLRSRLWLTYALLSGIILCVVGIGLVIYLIRNPPSTQRVYQRLQLIIVAITRRQSLLGVSTLDNPTLLLKQIDTAFDARIIVLDSNGSTKIDTRAGEVPSIPQLATRVLRSEVTASSLNHRRYIDSQGQVWLYIARRIEREQILIVAAPRPTIPLRQILREELIPPLFQAGIGAAVIALLLAIWMAHWVTGPLQRMTRSARSLATGKHEPIPVEGPGEVQELARSYNEMSVRVQSTQQSQRDFIANVSHDLKTPLTSIQGFAQAILDGTANSPEKLSQAAGVISQEADRMHHMVLDLLDLARLDSGIADFNYQSVDIAAILEDLVEKMAPQAHQAQVNLKTEIEPLPPISGDEDRLLQAFMNITDNAIKFTPPNADITIHARQNGNSIEVSVSDTGPGISAEDLPHVFDRFYQVDKSRSRERLGSGLGLSIAREIFQAHKGTIDAHSQGGKGTTITVTLPITQPGKKQPVKQSKNIRAAGIPDQ